MHLSEEEHFWSINIFKELAETKKIGKVYSLIDDIWNIGEFYLILWMLSFPREDTTGANNLEVYILEEVASLVCIFDSRDSLELKLFQICVEVDISHFWFLK